VDPPERTTFCAENKDTFFKFIFKQVSQKPTHCRSDYLNLNIIRKLTSYTEHLKHCSISTGGPQSPTFFIPFKEEFYVQYIIAKEKDAIKIVS